MCKKDNWFNNYQDIPELGIEGSHRLADRIKYYDQAEFKDASVLDIGCNIGQMCVQACGWGANRVMGVEYDATAHKKSLEIKEKLNLDINFVLDDLDSPFFWNSIGNFDICLFLSFIDTKELNNRYGILSKAAKHTLKTMYFEGHPEVVNPLGKYMNDLIYHTDFSQIVYKGQRHDRPFIKAERKVLDADGFLRSIIKSKMPKIVVVGKPLAGKTTLRKYLEENFAGNRTIIDDMIVTDKGWFGGTGSAKAAIEAVQRTNNYILFDYRGLEYIPDADAVYFITQPECKIGEHKSEAPYLRSPPDPMAMGSVKEFYTVML